MTLRLAGPDRAVSVRMAMPVIVDMLARAIGVRVHAIVIL